MEIKILMFVAGVLVVVIAGVVTMSLCIASGRDKREDE